MTWNHPAQILEKSLDMKFSQLTPPGVTEYLKKMHGKGILKLVTKARFKTEQKSMH